MKIAILLGSPDISGGTYVIFEHATRINRMGHLVTIVTEGVVEASRYAWHPFAGELSWITFDDLEEESFDQAIATWWQSVFLLQRIRSRKYLYFIQSIESRFFPEQDPEVFSLRDIDILKDWCENTYKINLPVITEARWIQDYLLEHYNRSSFLVRNGIRKDIYSETGTKLEERRHGQLRVLVEGPLGVFFKNVEKTIELCQEAGVQSIWLLTSSEIDSYPGVEKCFSRVPIHKTAEIYRSCDILVKLSYVEGMFGPPLEMFHCGGTAIVYDVSGHDEYIRHGENSIVVKCDNDDLVVDWLEKLQNDPILLEKLKTGAKATARQWSDWDTAAGEFCSALATIDNTYPVMSLPFLRETSEFLLSVRENGLRAREQFRMAEREVCGFDVAASFLNHIQVYWDSGSGIQAELTDNYQSGSWCRCSVIVPCDSAPKVLRVDPSVRIGIVEIRSLEVSGVDSGEILAHWNEGSIWDNVEVAGTACSLKKKPYLIIEAYGEDPQLFLPHLSNLRNKEQIKIEIEVREMGFAQTIARYGSIGNKERKRSEWLWSLLGKIWRKALS